MGNRGVEATYNWLSREFLSLDEGWGAMMEVGGNSYEQRRRRDCCAACEQTLEWATRDFYTYSKQHGWVHKDKHYCLQYLLAKVRHFECMMLQDNLNVLNKFQRRMHDDLKRLEDQVQSHCNTLERLTAPKRTPRRKTRTRKAPTRRRRK